MSNHSEYLNKVLLSRVYDVAVETPLDEAVSLSRRLGNRVLLKRDDLQPVFSFKLRGAYNKMARLSPEELRRGVIAASAGNHEPHFYRNGNVPDHSCPARPPRPATMPRAWPWPPAVWDAKPSSSCP